VPQRESRFIMRLRVHTHIVSMGADGSIDQEGQVATGYGPQTYTPRRYELVKEGSVVDSLETRKTSFDKDAIVWVATRFASPAALAASRVSLAIAANPGEHLGRLLAARKELNGELRAVKDEIARIRAAMVEVEMAAAGLEESD